MLLLHSRRAQPSLHSHQS